MKRSFLLGAVLLNLPAGGAQDMLNMTTIPSAISDTESSPLFQRSCTNPSGRIIAQGQTGYKECLDLARAKKPNAGDTPPPVVQDDSGGNGSKIILQPQ